MSESNMLSKERYLDNEDLKRKRRTRNDEDGRNFSCNCGKSYLSYPALYTHVKTKHNGKPEYAKIPSHTDEKESADVKDEDDGESLDRAEEGNNLTELKKYLNKFFPPTIKDKDLLDKKIRDLSKDDQLYLKSIKDYWEKHRKEEELHESESYATPIDFVLGKFLVDMETDSSRSCQKFLSEFVINLKGGLNEIKGNDEYCKSNSAAQMPTLMNELFSEKFQKMQESHIYLRHPTIICKTLYHFGRWLFNERFTNLSLRFNTL